MRKLDTGNMGRGYIAGLWLVTAAIFLIFGGKWIYEHAAPEYGGAALNSGIAILVVTLVHGTAAWGIFRRRFWGYCSSLVISAYWIIDSADVFFPPFHTAAPHRLPLIPFALNAVALAWLISPPLRSKFVRVSPSTRVVTPC